MEEKKKTPQQPTEEETPERPPEETPERTESIGNFFTPYGIILFIIAGLLDIAGLILLCFGLDDFWISDLIGLIFIGGLMAIGPGRITVTKGAQKLVKKGAKKLLKRLGLAVLGEIIPYFGGVAPCWTLAVYFHLRGS